MRVVSFITIFLCVFALYACSKTPSNPSQAMGSACSSDPYLVKYNCSVSRVQQLASQGDPDAQYALGYMYYYGVSTVRDEDSARLWISRSAAQGQPLAKKAMAMLNEDQASIKRNDSLIKDTIAEVKEVSAKIKKPGVYAHKRVVATHKPTPVVKKDTRRDDIGVKPTTISSKLPSIRKAQITVPIVKTAFTSNPIAQMEDALMLFPVDGYVLQLMGNHHLDVIEHFVKNHHLEGQTRYYAASFHNSPWYMLVYGKYDTVSEAHAAIKNLPKELQHMQPWIKPVRVIQAEIKTRNLIS